MDMLDLNFVRTNLDLVKQKLRDRGQDPDTMLGDFETLDLQRRERITEAEQLKAQRNKLSEEVARLKKSCQDAGVVMEETRALKTRIEELESTAVQSEEQMRALLARIPNLTRDEVPAGRS